MYLQIIKRIHHVNQLILINVMWERILLEPGNLNSISIAVNSAVTSAKDSTHLGLRRVTHRNIELNMIQRFAMRFQLWTWQREGGLPCIAAFLCI